MKALLKSNPGARRLSAAARVPELLCQHRRALQRLTGYLWQPQRGQHTNIFIKDAFQETAGRFRAPERPVKMFALCS